MTKRARRDIEDFLPKAAAERLDAQFNQQLGSMEHDRIDAERAREDHASEAANDERRT